jgi:hypothetical protein
LFVPECFSGGLGPDDHLKLAYSLCLCCWWLVHGTTITTCGLTGATTQRRPLVLTRTILQLVVLSDHGRSARPVDTKAFTPFRADKEKLFMHSTNLKCLRSKRNYLAALVVGPLLVSGCAHTGGGTAGRHRIPSDNPAMYRFNPATHDFEGRWPFGPANYH